MLMKTHLWLSSWSSTQPLEAINDSMLIVPRTNASHPAVINNNTIFLIVVGSDLVQVQLTPASSEN